LVAVGMLALAVFTSWLAFEALAAVACDANRLGRRTAKARDF